MGYMINRDNLLSWYWTNCPFYSFSFFFHLLSTVQHPVFITWLIVPMPIYMSVMTDPAAFSLKAVVIEMGLVLSMIIYFLV